MSNNESFKQMLFITFPGTMHRMFFGGVDDFHLQTGLFFLWGGRQYVTNPGAGGEPVENVVLECPELHRRLVAALSLAENEGRACWPSKDRTVAFDGLNRLLIANACSPIMSDHEYRWRYPNGELGYSFQAVQRRCPDLKIVWRRLRS